MQKQGQLNSELLLAFKRCSKAGAGIDFSVLSFCVGTLENLLTDIHELIPDLR